MTRRTAAGLALFVFGTCRLSMAHAAERGWFDWDRYHARQDACAAHDRLLRECAKGGLGACDEVALRQSARDCSAFSDRARPPPP
jgi:hypothetical protein